MSKEIAKKLIAELQTNEELKAKIAGITDPAEMVKTAVQNGYDVTVEEMIEAEREYRAETAKKSDELSADELEGAAGGTWWLNDKNKDGKEFNCDYCDLDYEYQKEHNEWCRYHYWCADKFYREDERGWY